MNDYLNQKLKFDKVSLRNLNSLLQILHRARKNDTSYLRNAYNRIANNFDENLTFLLSIGLVKLDNGNVILVKNFKNEAFELELLKAIFTKEYFRSSPIKDYLLRFKRYAKVYKYSPNSHQRVATSGIRNLLIELDIISHRDSTYIVTKKGLKYLNAARDQVSLQQLSVQLLDKDKIGLAAEKLILEYEKKALNDYPELATKIEHTSRLNVAAGYDIKSIEVTKTKLVDKYIEVKAVPFETFQFYWSRNEIECAQMHKDRYFLYLIPVKSKNIFDLKDLLVVRNPYKNIYKNKTWHKQVEVYSFSKNTTYQ